jgi:hypothetical protein
LDEADRKICSLLQLETSLDQDAPPAQAEKNPGEREMPPGSKH